MVRPYDLLMLTRRIFTSTAAPQLVHGFDICRIRRELALLWYVEESLGAKKQQDSCVENILACHLASRKWHYMCKEMSSNMAGETGAVWIYKGALAACRMRRSSMDLKVSGFAQRHIQAEQQHLDVITATVDAGKFTRILPIWRLAGYMLGFLPTFIGKGPWLYHTVEAVESFVEGHYGAQIDYIKQKWPHVEKLGRPEDRAHTSELLRFLSWACEDEVEHKEDARRSLLQIHGMKEEDDGIVVKVWKKIVGVGSWSAAEVAKSF